MVRRRGQELRHESSCHHCCLNPNLTSGAFVINPHHEKKLHVLDSRSQLPTTNQIARTWFDYVAAISVALEKPRISHWKLAHLCRKRNDEMARGQWEPSRNGVSCRKITAEAQTTGTVFRRASRACERRGRERGLAVEFMQKRSPVSALVGCQGLLARNTNPCPEFARRKTVTKS